MTADDPLARGVTLFNAGHFWEAHEAWEELWLADRTGERLFLQGLIQLAAAYHQARRGIRGGATRLFDAAFHKLEQFPSPTRGIDFSEALAAARASRAAVAAGSGTESEWIFAPLRDNRIW